MRNVHVRIQRLSKVAAREKDCDDHKVNKCSTWKVKSKMQSLTTKVYGKAFYFTGQDVYGKAFYFTCQDKVECVRLDSGKLIVL